MQKKIGFIAIGQAGGNIGKLFEDRGFSVLYLNTSPEDLQTLKNAKFVYHIAGGEGCNKDRTKAKQLVVNDFDNISKEIYEKMDVSMVYVIFSSGGGTGSGCGPMLIDLLLGDIEENPCSIKTVGAITILPEEKESTKAHINCYECLQELTDIENIASTIIIDNAKGEKLHLNKQFVKMFQNFINIPRLHHDERGNIDRAEIEETLKAKGMAVFAELPANVATTAALLDKLKKGIFAPIEPNRVIKYVTISIAGSVSVEEMHKEIGVPVDVFQTYNEKSVICCLSGLNYPMSRLEEIYKHATEHQETILKNLSATSESSMKKGVNFLTPEKKPEKEEAKPKQRTSRRDLLKKYL